MADAGQPSMLITLAPMLIIFAIFYVLLIRPQQKQQQEHAKMTAALRRGDKVVTGGGILGTVIRANEGENEITVEIAEGVRIRVLRHTVSALADSAKGEAAKSKVDQTGATVTTTVTTTVSAKSRSADGKSVSRED
jgi:preprotein translocase subunit YajC